MCSPARSRMLTVALENGSLVPGLGPPGAPTPQRQRGDPHQPILRLLFTVLKNRRPQNHERERGSLHHRRNAECLQGKHALKKERQLGKPSATPRTDHSGTGHEPPFLEKMLAARAAGAGGSPSATSLGLRWCVRAGRRRGELADTRPPCWQELTLA